MFVFKRGVVDDAATVCIATSIYMASTINRLRKNFYTSNTRISFFEIQCIMSLVCWPG